MTYLSLRSCSLSLFYGKYANPFWHDNYTVTAIVCGFLVGLYSDNDFDAIGGAVGILFVHDLDEKVFASMQLFRGTAYAVCKKLTAVSL